MLVIEYIGHIAQLYLLRLPDKLVLAVGTDASKLDHWGVQKSFLSDKCRPFCISMITESEFGVNCLNPWSHPISYKQSRLLVAVIVWRMLFFGMNKYIRVPDAHWRMVEQHNIY